MQPLNRENKMSHDAHTPPTTPPAKTFRVWLVEWVSYSTVLEAASAEAARDEAVRQFHEYGSDDFKCHDCGIELEGMIVEPWPPG